MTQQNLFDPVPRHRLESLSKEELIEFVELQQKVNDQFKKEVDRLSALNEELKQKTLLIDDQYVVLKNKFFGKSSERSPKQESDCKARGGQKTRVQLPSERYPNAPLIERDVDFTTAPSCGCCGTEMSDSGLTEDSEYVTVIPQQYIVVRQKRHKYRCSKCHGDIKTAPGPKRIKEGSAYSDEMAIDVSMAKYCDLVPVDRYATIAGRAGMKGLPPQSLIEATHNLADFTKAAYLKLKTEILASRFVHADETTHRMLEGSAKQSWYLWGFSTEKTSYFEIHDTRSGDVASDILTDPSSQCEYLMSDVFSGYTKAVRESNKIRETQGRVKIRSGFCNAHARRKFKEAEEKFPEEAEFFVTHYKKIYRLEKIAQARPPDRILRVRRIMRRLYDAMKAMALANQGAYSSKSSIGKAMSYFLTNYEGLTLFLDVAGLAIDNNPQERLLRNPVIGRKTWYGTHSERGAETTAVLFSLVESCKLNDVNPREYMKKLVQDLHQGLPAFTPSEYKNLPT